MEYKLMTTDKRTGKLFIEFCSDHWSSGNEKVQSGESIVFNDSGQNYKIHAKLYVENIIGEKHLQKPILVCSVE